MKPSINKLNEAKKAYEIYWDSYTKGDLETFASTLDDRFEMIGTSEAEVCHSKADGIEFLKAQLHEVVGKVEMRNRQIDVIPVDPLILVNEQCDIYVLIDFEWNFYSKIRISTLLRETKEGWKVTQQHGSLPDMRVQEGETLAIEKISKENLELRDAVKRRTAELENKNRELAIESALEKVRAVAMGMKKPEDMLEVCREISDRLQEFGVEKIRNIQTAIIDETIGQYLCYQYFTAYNKTAVEKTEYLKSPVEQGMVRQMLASRDGFFIGGLSGKELEAFRSHRKKENHFPDPFLDEATQLDYCFLSIGEGGLGLTLYQPMAEDVLTLFKRFHQVFSLAYQRFRDIQKAEAQTREAQIEVAVERVRAQSMAMHHPDDLDKVNKEILNQLQLLQVPGLTGVTFYLVDKDGWVKAWDFSSPGNIGDQNSYSLQYDFQKYELMGEPFEVFRQTDLNYFVADFPLEKLKRGVYELEEINPTVANLVKEALAKGILTHQWTACARISDGLLGVDLVSPPSEDTKTIVLKMAAAFNQAYTRFLDLQKAEAQAREAEIELALERVRARTMAMHYSSELADTATILFQQIKELGFEIWSCGFGIWRPEADLEEAWMSTGDLFPIILLPFKEDPSHLGIYEASQRGESVFEVEVKGDVLTRHYDWLMSQPSFKIVFGQIENSGIILPTVQFKYAAFFKQGYLHLITTKPQPDIHNINQRFAKVFEQTYTRFLDLQKAEAQARESQIQLALERVRARTMAMYKSEELTEVAVMLYKELFSLEVTQEFFECGYVEIDEANKIQRAWMTGPDGNLLESFNLPLTGEPIFDSRYEAWKQQIPIFHQVVAGDQLKRHIEFAIPYFDSKEAEEIARTQVPDSVVFYCGNFSHGYLAINCGLLLDAEGESLIARFTRVFEMTYLRFLDLKKAEAQAREAEIELALERVRARTMAMHHTEELKEVIQVVFDQFVGLNIHVEHAGFILDYKEKDDMHIWLADHQQGVPTEITIPYFDSPHWNSYLEAKANRASFFANLLPFEVKNKFYSDLFEWIPELTEEAQQAIFGKPGLAISTVLLDNVGLYIEHYSETPFTSEENAILMRFGKVFQQTYTRFLDLQKAEAQARESQIQLALERVRARTMAMHKSQELAEVAVVLYQELKTLGATQDFFECGYVEVDEINNLQRAWSTRPDGSFLKEPYYLPLTGEPVIDARYEAWKQRVPVCHQPVGGELLKRANEFVIPYMNNQEAAEISSSSTVPDPVHFYCGNFSHGYLNINCGEPLSAEEESLLARFTGVFEMTYQRFLDLQKAEAQAKDAQIELALERVRAKTMAIQKPDEFLDVISVIGEQFAHLGFDNEWVNFGANGLDISKGIDIWELVIMPDQYQSAQRVFIPYTEHILFRTLIEQFERYKKDGTNFFTLLLDKRELGKWLDHQYKETVYKEMPAEVKALGFSKPSAVSSYIILKDTWFEVGRFSTTHFTDEENEIFKRFANAFGQAYTRFLDLQKAEAQARESQIQLALERVRARTMAMQKSDELPDAANLLFQQVQSLGMPAWSAGYCTWVDDKRTSVTLWMSSEGVLQPPFTAPTTEDELFIEMRKGQEDGKAFHVVEMGGDKLVRHYQYMRTLPVVGEILDSIIEAGHPLPTFQIMHQAYFSKGFLLFIIYEPVPESHDIFIRFAQVFEQTYTRFLDLQKAEAQARKAQIEVAVERVRAKALAMHRSEEILGVAVSIRDAMVALDLQGVSAATIYLEQDNGSVRVWDITELLESEKGPYLNLDFEFRLEETDSDLWFHRIWNFKEKYCVVEMDQDDLWRCEAWLRTFDPKNADNFLRFLESGQITHLWLPTVSLERGKMNIDFVQPPPAEMEFILPKMAATFDLAYKRFLDLQKAEAQAREAQIEAALERVRSRSMAMHKSEELREVIQLVFEQFRLLNFNIDSAQFDPDYKASDDMNLWTAVPGQPYSTYQHIPYFDNPIFYSIKEAKEKKLSFHIQKLSFEKKNEFFRHFFKYITYVPKERQKLIFESPGFYRAVVFLENIALAIQNYSNVPYTNEEIAVLKRFGKTFEQVYTRFLDLQKAEAQAREAQIEAALEKVRGRTMAMHSSHELADAAYVLFEQLNFLGVTHERINIGIVNEDNHTIDFWVTEQGGNKLSTKFSGRISEPTTLSKAYHSWKKGEKSLVVDLNGKELKSWLHYLNEEIKIPFNKAYLHSRRVQTAGFFSKGMLILTSPEPLNEEALYLLEKFAGVFDLTYTRFNDLKIAEAQAREAQIEAALERVRSRSMAMHKSDELLEAGEILFSELQKLGIESLTAGFVLMDKQEKNGLNYTPDPSTKKIMSLPVIIPHHETVHLQRVVENWKKGTSHYVVEMDEEETIKHQTFIAERSTNFTLNAEQLIAISPARLFLHNFYFKEGYLLIVGGTRLSSEQIDIMLRFAKVFQQTYTRFLDLQKAEAQARESQIEAALERVRSRSMAMHDSKELGEVAKVMFNQMKLLGAELFAFGIVLCDKDKNVVEQWHGLGEGDMMTPFQVPIDLDYIHRYRYDQWKAGVELFSIEIPSDYIARHFELMFALPSVKTVMDDLKLKGIELGHPSWEIDYGASFKYGYLLVSSLQPYAEEKIFPRFAKVFEQAYTRFLDLQKAEAQARESQIEAALERVRSRTVGMQKSDELRDVIQVIYEQFLHLGIDLYGAAFAMDYRESEDWHIWSADLANLSPTLLHIPYFDHPYWNTWNDAKQKGLDTLAYTMAFAEKNSFVSEFGKHIPNLPAEALELVLSTPGYTVSNVFLKNVTLYIDRFTTEPYSDADNAILMRFGKVFEQTYTRFKDLEKAEAQAREAQIEAALERVRSRTMAMQRSEELPEVAGLLFQQVKALGVPQFQCGFNIFEIDDKECIWYPGSADGDILPPCKIPLTEHPIFMAFNESRKRGDELYVYEKEGEYQAGHYRYMLSLPVLGELLQNMLDAGIPFPTFQIDHIANFSHGNLLFITPEHFPEMHDTFKRFAKVFEQTYTRFLDLQKAEAQAREAQIEAALERVRSRTIALQNSDELLNVAILMFQLLKELGGNLFACGFTLLNENKTDSESWMSAEGEFLPPIIVPNEKEPVTRHMFEAWQQGAELYIEEAGGEELKAHYDIMVSLPTAGKIFKGMLEAGIQFPSWQRWHAAYFTHGYLLIITTQPFKDVDLFVRFAKVFDQTYTRFLDLQKAEAQAREAQIQLALERVRARTMAMQSSEELAEVSYLLNKQVVDLGIPTRGCAFNIYNEEDSTEWFSNLEGTIPTYKTPRENIFLKYYEAGQRGETLWIEEFGGDRIKEHYKYLATLSISGNEEETIESNLVKVPEYQIDHVAYFKYGYLLFITLVPAPEAHDVFRRFAKEFEQTYTRFLDLQKAEAQAREARIEVGLERVRARTMAMHSSNDVSMATATLFTELEKLGVQNLRGGIAVISPDQTQEVWSVTHLPEGITLRAIGVFDMRLHPFWRQLFKAFKTKEEFQYYWLAGEDKANYIALLNTTPHYLEQPITDLPDVHVQSYFFGEGAIWTNSLQPHSESEKQIMKKFVSVFSLTFRRYLDLQKAEAQAREAQIEAALERVRSTSLAMHSSQDLSKVVHIVFTELVKLDAKLDRCLILIVNPQTLGITWYLTGKEGLLSNNGFLVADNSHPSHLAYLEGWRTKRKKWHYLLAGEEKKSWDAYGFSQTELAQLPDFIKADMAAVESIHLSISSDDFGCLIASSLSPLSEVHEGIVDRFTTVFNQTYTRFLDLQKAEAQAREAQIEAALEKVRSRSMAMHNSQELKEVALELRKQMGLLGQKDLEVCAIHLYDKENSFESWSAMKAPGSDSDIVQTQARFSKKGIRIIDELLHHYTNGTKDYVLVNEGEKMLEWFEALKRQAPELYASIIQSLNEVPLDKLKGNWSVADFSGGALVMVTYGEADMSSRTLLRRSANVFEQAYTRFLDLQKAEAQAREAQVEVALERIRARALAMQSSTELGEVAKVLRDQMGILGQEDLEASVVHLYSADSPTFDSWYAFRAGDHIIEGVATFSLENSALAKEFLKLYEDEVTEYTIEVKGAKLKEWLAEIKRNAPKIAAYWGDLPPEKQFYHFSDFSGGALLMVSHENLTEETQMLQKRCALVFELAYKRFLDLEAKERQERELLEEKLRLEHALSELKATQSQLVQQEKLASLGQLTAGIAHEIKNPLNFVNNFSEVSLEMIEEVIEERSKSEETRDETLVDEILVDIKSNLQKVHDHGTRANGIVTSMLQHSRASSGKMAPSDLNALIKEYVNLCFHGMRANKNPIDVDIQLELEPSLEPVSLIKEDFTRVVINLCNNAFDAMREKFLKTEDKRRKAEDSETVKYNPKLKVTTSLENGQVRISFEDNGPGIPDEIKDKILQPFFTTKKGTEGTGLGLSITHDIIKAHGGELSVETSIDYGAKFIIKLNK